MCCSLLEMFMFIYLGKKCIIIEHIIMPIYYHRAQISRLSEIIISYYTYTLYPTLVLSPTNSYIYIYIYIYKHIYKSTLVLHLYYISYYRRLGNGLEIIGVRVTPALALAALTTARPRGRLYYTIS